MTVGLSCVQCQGALGWSKEQTGCSKNIFSPYSTTIPFSVLQEFELTDPHHCLDHHFGLTLSVTEQ